jgi:iron complex transport system substrate-binding protein
MPASAFLAFSAAARVASLNLCTDEYLLLLARPEEVVSVSYLSQDPLESPLWRAARAHKGNRGSIEDVIAQKPSLVLTMGGGGRSTSLLARRLQLRALDLPYASTLDDVVRNVRIVAAALDAPQRAEAWVSRIERLRQTSPRDAVDAMWVSSGGESLAPGSLGTEWLRLAGLQQRGVVGGRVTLEAMLTMAPKILVVSDYRSGQMSGGTRWLNHPIVRRAPSRRLRTDGRPWTCMGPLMVQEIERLRSAAR